MLPAILLALVVLPGLARADTPEESLGKAADLENAGHLSRAVEIYKDIIKSNPDYSQLLDVRFRLARCYDNMGLVDEAVAELTAVVDSKEKKFRRRVDAFYTLGKLYGSLKDYEKATRTFEAMLNEGAGLYEDEVLNICGGYYALLNKPNEAAAKFNVLKRRANSKYAEQAAVKLALLWLKAGPDKIDLAKAAIEDLAAGFEANPQIPALLVQIADLYRTRKKFTECVAVCQQVISRYPAKPEALAARHMLGLCQKDQGKFKEAAEVFDQIAKLPEARTQAAQGLAAEAYFQAAEVFRNDLNDPDQAMPRYQEAAAAARALDTDRARAIQEQCYFTLAEHQFAKKNYAAAMENYLLLRSTGSKLNVVGRIIQCQSALNLTDTASVGSTNDVETLKKKIEQNAGTFAAAEAETFLVDQEVRKAGPGVSNAALVEKYDAIRKKYPADMLKQNSLAAYLHLQIGLCLGSAGTKESMLKAADAFKRCADADPAGPYATLALENQALAAERAGDRATASAVYRKLFDSASAKLEAKKDDADLQRRSSDYLRSMLTRADTPSAVDEALATARSVIDKKGVFSKAARDAQFYIGELFMMKKDYSAAAREFKQFIKLYAGPK
ncbi:MAG: tetratricopeptide repeat protein, partial [Phycisphaerae bacterium]|nr:tetratricopeptide repeat protein [Phycisphaerae bacterium]